MGVFEVDQPASREWKRARLVELGFGVPPFLHLVPVDLARRAQLEAAGFDPKAPTFLASTGVSMYLTRGSASEFRAEERRFAAPAARVQSGRMVSANRIDGMTDDGRATGNELVIEGQKRALERALHGAKLSEVLEILVRTVESQSSTEVLGSVLLFDPETRRLRHGAAPSLAEPYTKAIDGLEIGPSVGSCGTAAFRAETVVVTDIQTDPLWSDFRDLAAAHGLRACWSTPILSSAAKVLGTFALYHRVPALPTARDREIVELLGRTAALVIERDLEVSRRAAAEAALRAEKEQRLARVSAMFEHAPAGIAILRGQDHVLDAANAKYLELVGRRDVVGKPLRDALPEVREQGLLETLDDVRRTGRPFVGRAVRVSLARGAGGALEDAYFDFVYEPLPGEAGVEGILVVVFEVSDLARAKMEAETARLRAETSERALETLIDNLPALAWTAGPDGSVDFCNRRFVEYAGAPAESVLGRGWERLVDPAVLPDVQARWGRCLETGQPFEMELRLRGADGVARWFLTRAAPQRDAAGAPVRWFGTNTDIDEIKASRALAEEVALQSRDTLHVLLELRRAKEAAEKRVAELEAERRSR